MWPRNHTERYERELHGGAKQPRDLRAQKSFEQDRDSGCVFSGSLASPVKGGIESRRMHQMPQEKAKTNPQRDTVMRNQESTNALLGSLVVGHIG